jgi:hypothetical protein
LMLMLMLMSHQHSHDTFTQVPGAEHGRLLLGALPMLSSSVLGLRGVQRSEYSGLPNWLGDRGVPGMLVRDTRAASCCRSWFCLSLQSTQTYRHSLKANAECNSLHCKCQAVRSAPDNARQSEPAKTFYLSAADAASARSALHVALCSCCLRRPMSDCCLITFCCRAAISL